MKNWNDIPEELKEIIVFHLTHDTRSSLSSCSKLEYRLAKNYQRNEIKEMKIVILPRQWSISITDMFDETVDKKFHSFDEFQEALTIKMKELTSIKKLSMTCMQTKAPLINLLTDKDREHCRLRKVEEVHFKINNNDRIAYHLKQIEPFYLRSVQTHWVHLKNSFYDLPQIVNAEKLSILDRKYCITEKQLFNLKAKSIYLNAKFCVNAYIKWRVERTNVMLGDFVFVLAHKSLLEESVKDWVPNRDDLKCFKMFFVETPFPHLQWDIRCQTNSVSGHIRFDSERSASLSFLNGRFMPRIIDVVIVEADDYACAVQAIRKGNYQRNSYCRKFHEAQKKLDEILENVDYIKEFTIKGANRLKFQERAKKLMVRRLEVEGKGVYRMLRDLLEQIDPAYLKNFILSAKLMKKDVLEMPQVTNAEYVDIIHTMLSDDQLLKMNAEGMCNAAHIGRGTLPLTAAGLNQFVKKCLIDLNVKKYSFSFHVWPVLRLNRAEIFKDLDVTESYEEPGKIKFVINSIHPDHVLAVSFGENHLFLDRELRKKPL